MADMVQTFRVTHDSLKVGNTERQYGDLVPEAASWPNLRTYESAGYVEKVWVADAEMQAHYEKYPQKVEVEAEAETETVEKPKTDKKTAKKRVVRRSKNVEEKQEGAGDSAGPVLAESSV